MKNKKTIIIVIALVIVGSVVAILFTNNQPKSKKEDKKIEEKKKLTIDEHREKFEKILEKDYKMEGYVFEYESTDDAFIVYNRINEATGEMVQQLAYEILTSNISIVVATDKMNTFTE